MLLLLLVWLLVVAVFVVADAGRCCGCRCQTLLAMLQWLLLLQSCVFSVFAVASVCGPQFVEIFDVRVAIGVSAVVANVVVVVNALPSTFQWHSVPTVSAGFGLLLLLLLCNVAAAVVVERRCSLIVPAVAAIAVAMAVLLQLVLE